MKENLSVDDCPRSVFCFYDGNLIFFRFYHFLCLQDEYIKNWYYCLKRFNTLGGSGRIFNWHAGQCALAKDKKLSFIDILIVTKKLDKCAQILWNAKNYLFTSTSRSSKSVSWCFPPLLIVYSIMTIDCNKSKIAHLLGFVALRIIPDFLTKFCACIISLRIRSNLANRNYRPYSKRSKRLI